MDDPEDALPPSQLTRAGFIERFGRVFEHSAWIAEQTWERGLSHESDSAEGLHAEMVAVLDDADDEAKRALIDAHPDLAGRLAMGGKLTAASTSEQASAGLDHCSPAEYEQFQHLNAAYRDRFEFPFIMAVRGSSRTDILAAFKRRLQNDRDTELATAIAEVKKIALLRLRDMLP